jgi:hypothetical protein
MERTFISTGERIRNYLGVGLLLSLMLNAFVTPLYPDLTTSNTYVRPDVFSVSHTTRVSTPLPKPTPPPTHRMTPRAQAAAKPFAATPPKTHGTSGPAEPAYVPPANAVPGGIPGSDGTAPTSDATTGDDGALVFGVRARAGYDQCARPASRCKDLPVIQQRSDRSVSATCSAPNNLRSENRELCACGTYIFHADFSPN